MHIRTRHLACLFQLQMLPLPQVRPEIRWVVLRTKLVICPMEESTEHRAQSILKSSFKAAQSNKKLELLSFLIVGLCLFEINTQLVIQIFGC